MPRGKKLAGATPKENRAYEHIKESYEEAGKPADKAKELAARTVNARKSKKKKE